MASPGVRLMRELSTETVALDFKQIAKTKRP